MTARADADSTVRSPQTANNIGHCGKLSELCVRRLGACLAELQTRTRLSRGESVHPSVATAIATIGAQSCSHNDGQSKRREVR